MTYLLKVGSQRIRKGDHSSVCLYSTFTYIWLGRLLALSLILARFYAHSVLLKGKGQQSIR